MNISLVTFPVPLLRLILCGGEGLPPAWGPLVQGADAWAWIPTFGRVASSDRHAYPYGGRDLLSSPEAWSLPLDADSPWPARLAMVAAWMLGRSGVGVWLGDNDLFVTLNIATARNTIIQVAWQRFIGQRYVGSVLAPSLPTLPQHLQTHPPTIALLLALYDVPEIRARVESA